MRAGILVVAAALAACIDPVHGDAVDALGPEAAGVKEGPLHRPGQPCTTCHGGAGPGEPDFVLAGTVYAKIDSEEPAAGASVTVTDVNGAARSFGTNAAGNFYVTRTEWDPVFPLRVAVAYGDAKKEMLTSIRRDGGCGRCHQKEGDASHAPRVYMTP